MENSKSPEASTSTFEESHTTSHDNQTIHLVSECNTDNETKILFKTLYIGILIGLFMIIALSSIKYDETIDSIMLGLPLIYFHISVSSISILALSWTIIFYICRFIYVYQLRKKWTPFRRKLSFLHFAKLILQWINVLFYLTPNAYVSFDTCRIIGNFVNWCGYVRSTVWTTLFSIFIVEAKFFRDYLVTPPNAIKSKFKLKYRLKSLFKDYILVFLFWASGEVLVYFVWLLEVNFEEFRIQSSLDCNKFISSEIGISGSSVKIITSFLFIYHVVAIGIAMHYLNIANQHLRNQSYAQIRWINISFRYHTRSILCVGYFVSLSSLFLWFTQINKSIGILVAGLGFAPSQMVMSLHAIIDSILYMPAGDMKLRHDYNCERNLTWHEDDLCLKKINNEIGFSGDKRQKGLFRLTSGRQKFETFQNDHNQFCFELAMKLYYWSEVSYEYNAEMDTCNDPFDLDLAKQLFNLKYHKYFWFKKWDVHVVIAWNHQTILISFRGTYSINNVFADCMCWRVAHMPLRGSYFKRTMPLIHHGFHECWTGENLNYTILNQVIQIVTSNAFNRNEANLMLTGHSMGGALAILAAYDIRKYCGISGKQILCYTFGAPRVGNRAFVKDYGEKLPNTWQVINDMDVVPRSMKFLFLYKHVGKHVLINELGDMIVCPYFVELKLKTNYSQMFPFYFFRKANVIRHHRLCSYRKSLNAVVQAQFSCMKCLMGGKAGVEALILKHGDKIDDILGNDESLCKLDVIDVL